MKIACQILFFLSLAFVVPSALLAIGFAGGIPTGAGFWLTVAIPLVPLFGWRRIKNIELTSDDIERSR